MCGRFVVTSETKAVVEAFGIGKVWFQMPHSYNVAPSQPVPVVLRDPERRILTAMRWGLVPSWAKDPSIGHKMINARSETAAEKTSFRQAYRHRRCLVLADGFYEWQRRGKKKQPMFIYLRARGPMALAGLWERWQGQDGEEIDTCTILTTTPNDFVASIHDRMPVILSAEAQTRWLDPRLRDVRSLGELCRPYPAEAMAAHEVTPKVGSPAYNQADCIAAYTPTPVEEEVPAQGSLFSLF